MENPTTPDGAKDIPTPTTPVLAPPNPEPGQKNPERVVPVAERLPTWVKLVLVVLPVLAFIISIFSLSVSVKSLRFSMGYTRPYEDHDLIARVLGAEAFTKGVSSIVTNGELIVNLALINKGNQTEIIREVFLCYSDTNVFYGRGMSWERNNPQLNIQLIKGERRVIRLATVFSSINTGKRMWLG